MNSNKKLPNNSSLLGTKRIFLASSASMALAACGSGNDAFVPAVLSSSDSIEDRLPKSLTESTVIEKGILQDLAALVGTLISELRNCKDDVLRWNQIAIDASGLDHTPTRPGETRAFGQQLGPGRSSRAMAIVHIAMYDAIASITRAYKPYSALPSVPIYSDIAAAIAKAAFDTLSALFPAQQSIFQAALTKDLARINNIEARALKVGLRGSSRALGLQAGSQAATAILNDRSNDGSNHPEPIYGVDFIPKAGAGIWSPDPISKAKKAVGAKWGQVRPFTLQSGDQYRLPAPPALGSAAYAAAYNDVQRLGGDGITTPSSRTAEQTQVGVFWAYDGTPSLCAPPRLYNQITTKIAMQQGSRTLELMRLLLLANVAMADSAIASWDSKYFHQTWRPVTGLRANILGEPNGSATPNFTPLGAPATNLTTPNFTPPFPAYPSGHATFGSALFQTLRNFYRNDNIAFTFVSDEYNGVTKDNLGNARPYLPRSFSSLSQAEEENGLSRTYLGIHWDFDRTEGTKQGRQVADWVSANI
jgi:PAP2 superfamily